MVNVQKPTDSERSLALFGFAWAEMTFKGVVFSLLAGGQEGEFDRS